MIHTDGRPTISSYGSPVRAVGSQAVTTIDPIGLHEERQLMERESGSTRVELFKLGPDIFVRVIEAGGLNDERVLVGRVPPSDALGAFEHPYLYVSRIA